MSGYAGIGKSSLVNELHKFLVPFARPVRGGQVRSVQARHPLRDAGAGVSEPGAPAAQQGRRGARRWRPRLQEALGPNGQLMVNLIPELALIIGEQPPIADLAAARRAEALPARVPPLARRVRPAGASAGALPRRPALARRRHGRTCSSVSSGTRDRTFPAHRRVSGQRGRPGAPADAHAADRCARREREIHALRARSPHIARRRTARRGRAARGAGPRAAPGRADLRQDRRKPVLHDRSSSRRWPTKGCWHSIPRPLPGNGIWSGSAPRASPTMSRI